DLPRRRGPRRQRAYAGDRAEVRKPDLDADRASSEAAGSQSAANVFGQTQQLAMDVWFGSEVLAQGVVGADRLLHLVRLDRSRVDSAGQRREVFGHGRTDGAPQRVERGA